MRIPLLRSFLHGANLARGVVVSAEAIGTTTGSTAGRAPIITFELYRHDLGKPSMQIYEVNNKYGPTMMGTLNPVKREIGPTLMTHLCPTTTVCSLNRLGDRTSATWLGIGSSRAIHTSATLCTPRYRQMRKRKMMKHKRRKRIDRDWFQYQKRHARKKQKAEVLFRGRMKELRDELTEFDAMKYVKNVIKRAQRDWSNRLSPSGRKKYNHWSQATTLEELYGVGNSTYIDKRSGFPTPEDKAKIAHLREDYFRRYTIGVGSKKRVD